MNRPFARDLTAGLIGRRGVLAAMPAMLAAPVLAETPSDFPVERYGASGDGRRDDTAAIQRAIDACAKHGGGTVRLAAGGRYLCATIILKDFVTLDIAGGATLVASTNRAAYRDKGALIFAEGARGVSVTGRGTIDGQGTDKAWFPTLVEGSYPVPDAFLGYWNPLDEFPGEYAENGRPRIILLVGCRNVRLADIRIQDAPTWTIHPVGCEDVLIEGLTIDNNLLVPNCDGIDIDRCRRVRITGCAIRAGDDCLIVKSSRNFVKFGDCEEIAITNCTLESSSAGFKIEPEGPGTLRNIAISNCTVSRSNRGIAVFQRDGATIEDLLFSNLTITTQRHHPMWWGAGEAVNLTNLPRRRSMAPGIVRGVRFDNLLCRGEGGLYVRGWPGSTTRDITFRGVRIAIEKTSRYPADTYDIRPTELMEGLYKSRIAAVYLQDAADVTLDDVSVEWAPDLPPTFGAALEAQRVDGLALKGFRGVAAQAGMPGRHIEHTRLMSFS